MSVITGQERRRNLSNEQKLMMFAEAFGPGGVVADVARRADVGTGQLYRWRREFQPKPAFVPAVVREESAAPMRSGGGGGILRGRAEVITDGERTSAPRSGPLSGAGRCSSGSR